MTVYGMRALRGMAIYFTVFVTGSAVMVIELLGTRMIAPFYGTSLYVWSSLISVTMIALAAGYFAGGWFADRAKRIGLSLIVSLAGLLTLVIPWLTRSVLLATDPLGLRAGAFVSALILFSPSLTLLGMVGPFAIKLATSRLEGIGTGAGSIYAVSTLGSVAGTLLLGFFLFPLVGSREILCGLGGALLLLGLGISFGERARLPARFAVLPCSLLTAIGYLAISQLPGSSQRSGQDPGEFRIRSERESLYGWVRVIDQPARRLRMLTSDASMIGAASLTTGASRLTYQDIVHLIPAMVPSIRRALLIGQGAGHMAMVLRDQYGIATDTIELDPAVADAASEYFGFRPDARSIVGDARYEIRHLSGPYDLIIHDCFTGGSEPAHLLTVEALAQLQRLLSQHGVLALNFVAFADAGRNPALASVFLTLGEVFPHRAVFVSEPGKDFNDYIFLASSRPVDLSAKSLSAEQSAWLKQRLIAVDPAAGVVLTDNLNPLEHLQIAKAEHYRRFIVDWLGPELLIR